MLYQRSLHLLAAQLGISGDKRFQVPLKLSWEEKKNKILTQL